jgi:hypothetical protein
MSKNNDSDSEFDAILFNCGYGSINSPVAREHLKTYLAMAKRFTGMEEHKFLDRCRIAVGINQRYVKEIHSGFLSWDIVQKSNGCIYFIGIPETMKQEFKNKEKEELSQEQLKEELLQGQLKEKPFNDLGIDLQTYLQPHKDKSRKELIEIIENAKINQTLKNVWLKDLKTEVKA